MSENTDLNSMTKAELKAQAEILGVSVDGNPTADTLRSMIREALGEPDPREQPAATGKKANSIAVLAGEKTYTIEIHKDGKDKQPVPLGCNGRTVRIKRGEKVTIGESMMESLRNAVENRFDTEAEEWIKVPSYPYTVLSTEG